MLIVVLLIILAIVAGGLGLIVDALQFLLGVAGVLVLIAVVAGFWIRGKAADALGSSNDGPAGGP